MFKCFIYNTSYLMNIFIHVSWHVKVHYQLNIDQVQPSSKNTSADHYFKLTLK